MNIDQYSLSAREKEVVELLLQGRSNKEMALALGVSVSTVEFHLKNVYRKLQVKSRTEAILLLGASAGEAVGGEPGQAIGAADGKLRESSVDEAGEKAENDGNISRKQVISMKQRFAIVGGTAAIFLLVTVLILARGFRAPAALPGSDPSAAAVTDSATASPLMNEMGTSFVLPPGLADGTQDEIVPASSGYAVWPRHVKLTLVDYPLPDTAQVPQMLVFPLEEYRGLDECSAAVIGALEGMLQAQALSVTEPLSCSSNPDALPLPLLPDQHAAQVLHARQKLLAFQNGNGLRYITQYSQAHFPAPDNQDLFYTFQGLTNDGKYYVSVMLPVHLDALQTVAAPQNAGESDSAVQVAVDLLEREDAFFTPPLESLDALVQSITVNGLP